MVRIGDQVHTETFAYLYVYAIITDSVVPSILHRNIQNQSYLSCYLFETTKPDVKVKFRHRPFLPLSFIQIFCIICKLMNINEIKAK